MRRHLISVLILFGTLACADIANSADEKAAARPAVATFAGGCFWCIEAAFEKVDGVESAVSGFTGGRDKNPTYKAVSNGTTDHVEAVQVRYDSSVVSYRKLLAVFWGQIDPTDDGGQFADRGNHYRTAIYYHSEEQRRLAETSKAELAKSGLFSKPIATRILRAGEFYPAESYHQDFFKTNPKRYGSYHVGSGRAGYIERTWSGDAAKGKRYTRPTRDELEDSLTPLQFRVTQDDATEPPFKNEYWDNKREGIYVDVVTGEPLFSSTDKFKSGSGWPSFTRPLEPDRIVRKRDAKLGTLRTEVRSRDGDSHLGHVFDDGPEPTGLRYCINSAALRFIARSELEKAGYGQYLHLFRETAPGK